MDLYLAPSVGRSKLLKSVLDKQQHTLQELALSIFILRRGTRDPGPALAALDGLRALRKLELFYDANASDQWLVLDYQFSTLSSLQQVKFGNNLSRNLMSSLLQASRAALRVVDTHLQKEDLVAELAQCTALTEAIIRASKDLAQLQHVKTLDTLTVHCFTNQDLALLKEYLDLGRLPRVLRVELAAAVDLPRAASSFKRVRSLTMYPRNMAVDVLLHCLAKMPALEYLNLRWGDVDMDALVHGWTAETAPQLKKLKASHDTATGDGWRSELLKLRPHLEIED